jgi:hypothetical protein
MNVVSDPHTDVLKAVQVLALASLFRYLSVSLAKSSRTVHVLKTGGIDSKHGPNTSQGRKSASATIEDEEPLIERPI